MEPNGPNHQKRRPKRYRNVTGKAAAPSSVDLNSYSRKSRRKVHNLRRVLINMVAVTLIVCSTIVLCGYYWYNSINNRLVATGESATKDSSGVSYAPVVSSLNVDQTNILIAGIDPTGINTDILMVVCFDNKDQTASILQIPRDLYIGSDVPTGKINAVYSNPRPGETSINALMRRLNDDLGIPIDKFIVINVASFRNIIDAVGGITMDVPQKLTIYDLGDHLWHTLEPGTQTLDGDLAEGYIRDRMNYSEGDIGRETADRLFYAAFAKKIMEMTPTQMISVAVSCYQDVTTNFTLDEIQAYAMAVRHIPTSQIRIFGMPGVSPPGDITPPGLHEALSYFSIYKQQYVDMMNEWFDPFQTHQLTVDDLQITELIDPSEYPSEFSSEPITFDNLQNGVTSVSSTSSGG